MDMKKSARILKMDKDPAPVIKWSGSKRSQSDKITSLFPKFERYYEPFLGGGSVMIRSGAREAVCGDICGPLIGLWNRIKDDPSGVAEAYATRWAMLQTNGHQVYYEIREKFNTGQDPHDLLFLSRTCVNGLIRFNRQGKFNNALHITRPGINPETMSKIIRRWSELIQKFEFVGGHYSDTTRGITAGDFVYLDPPYFNTAGQYYGRIIHGEFLDYLERLNSSGIKFALSFDGLRGSKEFFVDIPSSLFKRHILIDAGNSPFKKVMDREVEPVKESLYLNF